MYLIISILVFFKSIKSASCAIIHVQKKNAFILLQRTLKFRNSEQIVSSKSKKNGKWKKDQPKFRNKLFGIVR